MENILLRKHKLKKEKELLIKIKSAEEFLSLDEETIANYINILDVCDISKTISAYSAGTFIAFLSQYIYVLKVDDELKQDILNSQFNMSEIITDLTKPVYLYFFIIVFISHIVFDKSYEIYKIAKKNKEIIEEEEPKLKGLKYIDYVEDSD